MLSGPYQKCPALRDGRLEGLCRNKLSRHLNEAFPPNAISRKWPVHRRLLLLLLLHRPGANRTSNPRNRIMMFSRSLKPVPSFVSTQRNLQFTQFLNLKFRCQTIGRVTHSLHEKSTRRTPRQKPYANRRGHGKVSTGRLPSSFSISWPFIQP